MPRANAAIAFHMGRFRRIPGSFSFGLRTDCESRGMLIDRALTGS
jgi:hypothetical protein